MPITTGPAHLGTVLGVWAHPDDEAYLSAGLMALARDHGERVVCVTATRGERGTADPVTWPPDRLAEVRTAELARSLAVLDVREHHWLGLPDGGCEPADPAPVERLAALIARVRPHTVVTFGPDGLTGHPDHRAVSAWTYQAFLRTAPPRARLWHAAMPERRRHWEAAIDGLGVYPPGLPEYHPQDRLVVDWALPPALADRKLRALLAQATQVGGLIEALGAETYAAWVAEEAYVEAAVRPAAGAPPWTAGWDVDAC